jgi:dipeptide/tripeptide permease
MYGKGGLPGFIFALLLMGAGTGLVKPNMIVFLSMYTKTRMLALFANHQQSTNVLRRSLWL